MPTKKSKFITAKKFLKVQAVLSIIFGIIGTVAGFVGIVLSINLFSYASVKYYYDLGDWVAVSLYIAAIVLFWILPNMCMTIMGSLLIRSPKPKLAKGLTITNVVMGGIVNYIVLAFAIVSILKMGDYKAGYKK